MGRSKNTMSTNRNSKRALKLSLLGITLGLSSIGLAVGLYFIFSPPKSIDSTNSSYVTQRGDNLVDARTNENIIESISRLTKGNFDNEYLKKEDFSKIEEDNNKKASDVSDGASENEKESSSLSTETTNEQSKITENTNNIEKNSDILKRITESNLKAEENLMKSTAVLDANNMDTMELERRSNVIDSLVDENSAANEKLVEEVRKTNKALNVIDKNIQEASTEIKKNRDEIEKNSNSIKEFVENQKNTYATNNDKPTNYYTKGELDALLGRRLDKGEFYTKEDSRNQLSNIVKMADVDGGFDLSPYITNENAKNSFFSLNGETGVGSIETSIRTFFRDSELVTKDYVVSLKKDKNVVLAGDSINVPIRTNLDIFTKSNELVDLLYATKKIEDLNLGDYIKESDQGFTAPVKGVDPTAPNHIATKGYTDGVSPAKSLVKKAGDTINGNISLIKDTDFKDRDLVTKKYADDLFTPDYSIIKYRKIDLLRLNVEEKETLSTTYKDVNLIIGNNVVNSAFPVKNYKNRWYRENNIVLFDNLPGPREFKLDLGLDQYKDEFESFRVYNTGRDAIESGLNGTLNRAKADGKTEAETDKLLQDRYNSLIRYSFFSIKRSPQGNYYLVDERPGQPPIEDYNKKEIVLLGFTPAYYHFYKDANGYWYNNFFPMEQKLIIRNNEFFVVETPKPITDAKLLSDRRWINRPGEGFTTITNFLRNFERLFSENIKDDTFTGKDSFYFKASHRVFATYLYQTKLSVNSRNVDESASKVAIRPISIETSLNSNNDVLEGENLIKIPQGTTRAYITTKSVTPLNREVSLEAQIIGVYEKADGTREETTLGSKLLNTNNIVGNEVTDTFDYEIVKTDKINADLKGIYLSYKTSGYRLTEVSVIPTPKIADSKIKLIYEKHNLQG